MAKFLIGTMDGKVRSAHNPPLNFSISNRYVVDVPQDLSVLAQTDSLSQLIFEKVVGIGNRTACRGLPFVFNDELTLVPNIDETQCSKCFIGPNKRCAMFPGGKLVTNLIPVSVQIANIYFHWYGFLLNSDEGPQPPSDIPVRPEPPRTLYNYDVVTKSFVDFNPDDVKLEMVDSTNTTVLITAVYESLQQPSGTVGPANVRLRFTNLSDRIIYLSDWIFFHDSAP